MSLHPRRPTPAPAPRALPTWLADALDRALAGRAALLAAVELPLDRGRNVVQPAFVRAVLAAASGAWSAGAAPRQVRAFVAHFVREALGARHAPDEVMHVAERAVGVVDAAFLVHGAAAFTSDPTIVERSITASITPR